MAMYFDLLVIAILAGVCLKVEGRSQRSRQPNIVMVMTDDQDVELGSMDFMPHTLRILRDGGAAFPNAYVSTPMCCPSRSSMLTGMYVHNHDVYTNNDNCSSTRWRQKYETKNFGTYLTNAGYRTGYFGKYLNKYEGRHIPPGWTEWAALIRNSRFYNYSINFNGQIVRHYDNYYRDYLTNLVANDSITFLRRSKQYFPNRPVAMVLSMPAPHGPEDAAPPHQHLFYNVTTHRTPSWNFAPNPDKQWILQFTGKMQPIQRTFTDAIHRKRLQTLQSVDEAILNVYNELLRLGELDNTYFIYTSDHGYHLGQYGLVKGKAMPYESDIKVPFYIRGPGITAGQSVSDIVLNIDIAPTLLHIAGVEQPAHMDGMSVLKAFHALNHLPGVKSSNKRRFRRDTFLVERGKITSKKLKEREQMEAERNDLSRTKDQRLEKECEKPEYQPPCKGKQQWVCRRKRGGRMRIYKCRHNTNNDSTPSTPPTPAGGAKCVCPPRLELGTHRGERRRQRQFLRGHVNQPQMLRGHTGWKRLGPSKVDQDSDDVTSDEIIDEEADWNHLGSSLNLKATRRRRDVDNTADTLVTSGDGDDSEDTSEETSVVLEDDHVFVTPPDVDSTEAPSTDLEKKPDTTVSEVVNKNDKEMWCRVLANSSVVCEPYTEVDWQVEKRRLDLMIEHFTAQLAKLQMMRRHLDDHPAVQLFNMPTEGSTTVIPQTEVAVSLLTTQQPVLETSTQHKVDFMTANAEECVCDPEQDIFVTSAAPSGRSEKRRRRWEDKQQRKAERRQSRLAVWRERIRKKEERRQLRQQAGRGGKRRRGEGTRKRGYYNGSPWGHPTGGKTPWLSEGRKSGPRHDPMCRREGLDCSRMDNDHWKVDPRWTLGPFCFCPNSNNNTYWCLRTINSTHNLLYCEFITGFISYYNLRKDPYQLRNAVHDLDYTVLQQLHYHLEQLKTCRGMDQCNARFTHREKSGGRRRNLGRSGAALWLQAAERGRYVNRWQQQRG